MASESAFDNFDRAFSYMRTCRFRCACGKQYWDSYNDSYDWGEGELEELQADPDAYGVDYAIDVISINGREYANACSCWRPEAERIIDWLEHNREQVADFLNSEKARMVAEANQLKVVD